MRSHSDPKLPLSQRRKTDGVPIFVAKQEWRDAGRKGIKRVAGYRMRCRKRRGVPQDRGARLIANVVHRPGSAASSIELTAFASLFQRLGDEMETRAIECQAK